MDVHCIHCSERVDHTTKQCRACGGDPWAKAAPDVIDLRVDDPERDSAELLAGLMAAYSEAPARARPRWGANSTSMLELDLRIVRVGRFPSEDDLLPAGVSPRRTWRRG